MQKVALIGVRQNDVHMLQFHHERSVIFYTFPEALALIDPPVKDSLGTMGSRLGASIVIPHYLIDRQTLQLLRKAEKSGEISMPKELLVHLTNTTPESVLDSWHENVARWLLNYLSKPQVVVPAQTKQVRKKFSDLEITESMTRDVFSVDCITSQGRKVTQDDLVIKPTGGKTRIT